MWSQCSLIIEKRCCTFSYENCGRDVLDRKSTSGYCPYVWGNLGTWRSIKQYSLLLYFVKTCGYKRLLGELEASTNGPIKMLCDIAKNLVHHIKHIEIGNIYLREDWEEDCLGSLYYFRVSNHRYTH